MSFTVTATTIKVEADGKVLGTIYKSPTAVTFVRNLSGPALTGTQLVDIGTYMQTL